MTKAEKRQLEDELAQIAVQKAWIARQQRHEPIEKPSVTFWQKVKTVLLHEF